MSRFYYSTVHGDDEVEHEFIVVDRKPLLGDYVVGRHLPIIVNHYDLAVDHRHIIRDHRLVLRKTGNIRPKYTKEGKAYDSTYSEWNRESASFLLTILLVIGVPALIIAIVVSALG